MKRMMVLLLVLAMVFALAACGGKYEESQTPDNMDSTPQTAATGEGRQEEMQLQVGNTDVTLEALMQAAPTSADQFIFAGSTESEFWVDAYTGTNNMVVIPAEHKGTLITSVTSYTFGVDSPVEAIRFNDTTPEIVDLLCATNDVLKIVVLGTGTQKIGMSSFQNCTSLEIVVLNEGLLEIGPLAFAACDSLQKIEIPSTVTYIHESSFSACHDDFTIYGEAGSYAEIFANENSIPFVAQ